LETLDAFDFNDTVKCLLETNPELHGKHYIKEVSQQLTDPPRQFMIMTSRSLHFYNKLRPVDILHRAISNTTSEVDAKIIHSFFERYGLTESCAICLSVICASDEDQVVSKATKIFFECGGVPTSAYSSQVTGNYLGRATGQTDVTYSGKHDGFILYFSRIIAPIWKSKVFADR
jgi:nuclear pore complex protein Nup155